MPYLLLTSIIWAFSFGLIKGGLEGIPSVVITVFRLGIAFLVFLPFFRPGKISKRLAVHLFLTGSVQYGLMYLFYIEAFRYLKAYEIALFTVFTPFFVTLANDLSERKLNLSAFANCLLAVAGGLVIQYRQLSSADLQHGFILMQLSNVCFAAGQIYYRRIMARENGTTDDLQAFALLYLGAVITALVAASGTEWSSLVITGPQMLILAYLGSIAAGLCFFMWNAGARQVSPGTLAIFNNLKIPLGIVVSLLFFGESASLPALVLGGSLMALALYLNERAQRARPMASSVCNDNEVEMKSA